MIMLVFALAFAISLTLAAVVAYHAIVLAVPNRAPSGRADRRAAVGVALLAQRVWRAASSPVPSNDTRASAWCRASGAEAHSRLNVPEAASRETA
jgi:hypothetical protein